ncbi:hypothetical protein [Bradyrhizobium sp. WSM3983]|uniref:hypothetical protein n=1 Tax=Bradyrhizobium sp. WSM3983 TaxID=1038867 RepID=UPI00041686BD|nr:hypothetical protein [Bradyrhizobium sp. WSM3983]
MAFLKAAIAYCASLGVTVERMITDNGSCYKFFAFRKTYTPRHQTHAHQILHLKAEWKAVRSHPSADLL